MSTNIAMWSGPRNLSTAMMRAFENRSDTEVWDEPFYAAYLSLTGIEHPMREAVITAGERDWRNVAAQCVAAGAHGSVFYQKHMTHHMVPEIDTDWLGGLQHGFLIRDPGRVLRSYAAKREGATLADIGITQQWALYQKVAEMLGSAPLVVDSDDFLHDPALYLQAMCSAWSIPYEESMLNWPAGLRDSDGVWASHWYGAVRQSTGFGRPRQPAQGELPGPLQQILEEAMPFYRKLRAQCLVLS